MDDLKNELRDFVAERDWQQFHTPKNLSMALSVEASELAEVFQWMTCEQSRNVPPGKMQAVRDEIGDVLIYLLRLSDELGVDPLEAAREKLIKNRVKYPAEQVRGKSLKYDEY